MKGRFNESKLLHVKVKYGSGNWFTKMCEWNRSANFCSSDTEGSTWNEGYKMISFAFPVIIHQFTNVFVSIVSVILMYLQRALEHPCQPESWRHFDQVKETGGVGGVRDWSRIWTAWCCWNWCGSIVCERREWKVAKPSLLCLVMA